MGLIRIKQVMMQIFLVIKGEKNIRKIISLQTKILDILELEKNWIKTIL